MRYETAGEPTSNLKWTKKTTQKIADELAELDIKVSQTTVGKILKNRKYSAKKCKSSKKRLDKVFLSKSKN